MRAATLLLGLGLLCSPVAGLCQTLDEARAFTLRLYEAYGHGSPNYLGPEARRVFSPRLLRLIRRDERLAHGEVGQLDGDPICDCQDSADLTQVRVDVEPAGPGRARAHVRFVLQTEPRRATLDLMAVDGRWRVDNIHTKDTPSLVRLLEGAGHR
jgi:hypothetical protein